MALPHELLMDLARHGAKSRIRELEAEVAERESLIHAIREEFGLRSERAAEADARENGKAKDPNRVDGEELVSLIQAEFSRSNGAVLNSADLAKTISQRIAPRTLGDKPGMRVTLALKRMPSVRKRGDGYVWN